MNMHLDIAVAITIGFAIGFAFGGLYKSVREYRQSLEHLRIVRDLTHEIDLLLKEREILLEIKRRWIIATEKLKEHFIE